MNTLDDVLILSIPAGRGIVKAMSRDIRRAIARNNSARGDALIAEVRRIVNGYLPGFAIAFGDGLLASWIAAARIIADVAQDVPKVIELEKPIQPVRWPVIEKAAAWLGARDLVPTDEIESVRRESRREGLVIAFDASEKLVANVRAAIVTAAEQGSDIRKFVKENAEFEMSDSELEAIYRTNLGLFYAEGQRAILDNPIVGNEFPYVLYSATHDGRVRDEHLAMEKLGLNGTAVYRRDDPVIQKFWPPWSWNCVLPGTKVSGSFVAAVKSFYRGQAVEIVTARGSVIRMTEKHPIPTENGWIAAGAIKKGDKLFRHELGGEIVPRSDWRSSQEHNEPTPIEQVFCSLRSFGHSELRRAEGRDFHGEGHSIDGDVEVVWSDPRLLSNAKSGVADHLGDFVFVKSFTSNVGRMNLPAPLRFRHRGPLETLRVGRAARFDAAFLKAVRDHVSTEAGSVRNALEGFPSQVVFGERRDAANLRPFAAAFHERQTFSVIAKSHAISGKNTFQARSTDAAFGSQLVKGFSGKITGDHGVEFGNYHAMGKYDGLPHRSHRGTVPNHALGQSVTAYPGILRQLVDRFPGLVSSDEVVHVRNFHWSGHVYDLQSETGLIISEGVTIGNCRCVVLPITLERAAELGVREAQRWVRSGRPPANPEFVEHPPFDLPNGWMAA